MNLLTHAIVEAEAPGAQRTMLFLHGILGSGANWRTFAKQFVAVRPSWRAVLVDLRKHGGSQDFAPPHNLRACVDDLLALEREIGPAHGVLGHSFGGKVALEYLFARKDLEVAWIVDSAPGARPDRRGSETTTRIVTMLDTLPERFATREAFIDYVQRQGNERSIAMWLAMNVRPAPDGNGYTMRVDVAAMRALLDDYFARDAWPILEDPARTTKVHLVAGGLSKVLDTGERAMAQRLATGSPGRSWLHVIPAAGHWVHVDAPVEFLELIVHYI
ncbi:MAG TPA: alpha/beta hydrolase [Polyangiaceae bacterium]